MNTTHTLRPARPAKVKAMAGSTIIAALEAAYADVRKNHADLPEVVFITGTGLMGRGAKWGHYGRDRWVVGRREDGTPTVTDASGRLPEIFIAGERLACGAADTLQTLIHEAVHALATVREVKEVSRDFRYHNMKFVALAEELGLEWPEGKTPDTTIGFSAVELREDARQAYASTIAALDAAIAAHMDTFHRLGLVGGKSEGDDETGKGGAEAPKMPAAPKPKSRSNLKASCGCGRIIRASAKVLADAPITCGTCGQDFVEVAE